MAGANEVDRISRLRIFQSLNLGADLRYQDLCRNDLRFSTGVSAFWPLSCCSLELKLPATSTSLAVFLVQSPSFCRPRRFNIQMQMDTRKWYSPQYLRVGTGRDDLVFQGT